MSSMSLAALVAGECPPGVYAMCEAPGTHDLAAAGASGWVVARLDRGSSKAEALAAFGRALDLPEHYGRNLDALWDCLRDVATPTLLVWEGSDALAESDPRALRAIVALLQDRAAQGGFAAVLVTPDPQLDLPRLDTP